MQRANLWCISIDSLFCNSVEDQALLDAETPSVSLGKRVCFTLTQSQKITASTSSFIVGARLCYFYAMTCDKTKAQILEVKITVELDLDI